MKTSVRVLTAITCLTALALLSGLTGCAGNRDHQSTAHFEDLRAAEAGDNPTTDQRMQDSRTAERVREALTAGVDYKYDGVRVFAAEGVVQLNGFVSTSAQKNNAGEVTSKVVGVKIVENNLAIKN